LDAPIVFRSHPSLSHIGRGREKTHVRRVNEDNRGTEELERGQRYFKLVASSRRISRLRYCARKREGKNIVHPHYHVKQSTSPQASQFVNGNCLILRSALRQNELGKLSERSAREDRGLGAFCMITSASPCSLFWVGRCC